MTRHGGLVSIECLQNVAALSASAELLLVHSVLSAAQCSEAGVHSVSAECTPKSTALVPSAQCSKHCVCRGARRSRGAVDSVKNSRSLGS